jgi:predicted metal-dependent HD superfamily phosphohydrolase
MPGNDPCLVEAELRARADYAAPGRHYHGEEHLDDCLAQLDAIDDLSDRERRLLRWAVLWHDSIYDPLRTDNEERSADRAEQELRDCGVDEGDAGEVARLVRLTRGHRVSGGDRLGALLVSIDLSILGAEPERYRAYARAVREEYGHLPDEAWRTGRAGVLKSLLAADPLYPDQRFRSLFERQARRNLADELSTLED